MKKNIFYIVFILSLASASSCKQALIEQMHSAIAANNFYKTAADAETAINGAFSPLQNQLYYQRTNWCITDLSADIFYVCNGNSPRLQYQMGQQSATNSLTGPYWQYTYQMIKNANDVIEYVPGIDINIAVKNDIVGNAYFLRALGYFDLVRIFGAVPLVLLNTSDQSLFPKRTSADSVYVQIIKDLQFAEANCLHMDALPASKIGRVTSEAASSMLARVFLQRASTSFAVATDNQNSLAECNKVISYSGSHPNVLTLVPNYASIFNPDTPNGPECIFSIQFGGYSPSSMNLTVWMFTPTDNPWHGYGAFLPYASFINAFDPIDNRKAVNVGLIFSGKTYISKYIDPALSYGSERCNFPVLRYADILLMQSEALNNINAGDVTKFNGINAVRTRAGLGSKLYSLSNTPSQADFINALANERLCELAIEGVRRYDLIRWNKFISVKAAQGYTIDQNHVLFPLPQTELDVNKNLTQSPGY